MSFILRIGQRSPIKRVGENRLHCSLL
jgi:hypothetical protein